MEGPLVYVLDDSSPFLARIEGMFWSSGFRVETFTQVVEAMTKIRLSPPDALLIDIQMPFLDGDKICQQLRKKHGKTFPIVFCSGLEDDELMERAEKAGADGWVSKRDLSSIAPKVFDVISRHNPKAIG